MKKQNILAKKRFNLAQRVKQINFDKLISIMFIIVFFCMSLSGLIITILNIMGYTGTRYIEVQFI